MQEKMPLMWLLSTKASELLAVCNFINTGIYHVDSPGNFSRFSEQLFFLGKKTNWTTFASIQSNTSGCSPPGSFYTNRYRYTFRKIALSWYCVFYASKAIYNVALLKRKYLEIFNPEVWFGLTRIIFHGCNSCWIVYSGEHEDKDLSFEDLFTPCFHPPPLRLSIWYFFVLFFHYFFS